MRSLTFNGGWYADALPDGRYVVLFTDGTMQTDAGPVPQVDYSYPLYPRLNPASLTSAFSGQAASGYVFSTFTWDGSMWSVSEDGNSGVYGCIYLADGTLIVNTGYAGSQGFRYVRPDNTIATGDETYGPNPYGLMEWTALASDLIIGQGQNGGALVWDRGTLRVLVEPPAGVRFIHATATGQTDADQFGLAFWGESGVPTTCMWGTLAELRALPVYQATPTPQPPVPIPPTPEPPMTQMPPAAWALIQECHRRFAYGLPVTEDGARQFTKICIEQLAYNYPSEGWCWKAADPGRPVSKDIVARQFGGRFEGWDILSAASLNGPRLLVDTPGWHDLSGQFPIVAGQNHQGWVWMPENHLDVPVPPTPQPPIPQPPVPPVPGQPTNAQILAAVQALQADFDRVFRG